MVSDVEILQAQQQSLLTGQPVDQILSQQQLVTPQQLSQQKEIIVESPAEIQAREQQQEIDRLDKSISSIDSRIKQAQATQQLPSTSDKTRDSLDNRINRLLESRGFLEEAKSNVSVGLSIQATRDISSQQIQQIGRESRQLTTRQAELLGIKQVSQEIPISQIHQQQTLTAFQNIFTGEIVLQSIDPLEAGRKGLKQIQVSIQTGRPVGEIPLISSIALARQQQQTRIQPRLESVISARTDLGKFEQVQDPNTLRRIKNKVLSTVRELGGLRTASSDALTDIFTQAEKDIAEGGRIVPIDTSIIRKESLQFIPEFLTDKELEKLSFGGLEELIRRKQKTLDFQTKKEIKKTQQKLDPILQSDVESVINDFEEGKINKTQATKQLKILEKAYKQNILNEISPSVDIRRKEVQDFIDVVAKKQRKVRALTLAPIRFGEGFLFGALIIAPAFAVVSAGASALGISQVAVVSATQLAILGGVATSLPIIIPSVKDFKKDPTAFLLENVPFITGAFIGSNPQIVKRLTNINKKFIDSQKQLLKDKSAKAGKGQQKNKQIQVQKSKEKVKLSLKEAKELIKQASDSDLKSFLEQLQKSDLSISNKQKIISLILESKTGVSILTESGEIIDSQLKLALKQGAQEGVFQAPQGKIPSLQPVETLSLGVLQTRLTLEDLQKISNKQLADNQKSINKQFSQAEVKRLFNQLSKNIIIQTTKQKVSLKSLQALSLTQLQKAQQPKKLKQKVSLKSLQALSLTQLQKAQQDSAQMILQQQKLEQKTKQKQATSLVSLQKTAQKQLLKSQQISTQQITASLRPRITKTKPKTKPPKLIIFQLIPELSLLKKKKPSKRGKAITKEVAWLPLGKFKGKFRKLSKHPFKTKKSALDRASRSIDVTTANTFKVKQVRIPKKFARPRKKEIGYFKRTENKYRDFKIRNGKKISLKNKFIEKKGKPRIDTIGEKEGLKLAKFIKQQKFLGYPKRRRSNPNLSVRPKKVIFETNILTEELGKVNF